MATRRKTLLPRALSKWGYCSRSEAEELVAAGRVRVNGSVRRDVLFEVDVAEDGVSVDGKLVGPASKIYLKMNKPRGVITTMSDPQGRRTVADFLPARFRGAMPVGRLDRDSSGLLVLTNDHDLGNQIVGADSGMKKVYQVTVRGRHPTKEFAPIRAGILLDGGERCRPAPVRVLETRQRSTRLEIVLTEGKNRQIRRSLAELGIEVDDLVRVQIGPIKLGGLASGDIRPLTPAELRALQRR